MHNRLKRTREKRGMKQADVCSGIVSPSHYSNIEACRHTPSLDTIKLIAKRLDVPFSYLLNTDSYDYDLEKHLLNYEKLIELRDKEGIHQFLQSYNKEFQFIDSIVQELQYNLLKFLKMSMLNQIEEAIVHYERNIFTIDPEQINVHIYKKYLYVSGLHSYYKRSFGQSVAFYQKVIDLDKSLKSKLYYNISLCFNAEKKYTEALDYVKSAKELYLKEHEWDKAGDCYNLISVILREMNQLNEAEKYIEKGFNLVREDSGFLKATLCHNLALIYKDRGDLASALRYINKSINLKTEVGSNDLFISYRVKLNILLEKRDEQNITETIFHAKQYVVTKLDLAHIKFIQSKFKWMLLDYEGYELFISESIQLYLEMESWKSLQQASEHYSLYLEGNSKYKKSLELQKLSNFALKKLHGGRLL